MWLKELKIAIIEKDTDRLNALMDSLPELSDADEINEALFLLKEATVIVTDLRDETQSAMVQMKKNIDFLQSTSSPITSKFDINS